MVSQDLQLPLVHPFLYLFSSNVQLVCIIKEYKAFDPQAKFRLHQIISAIISYLPSYPRKKGRKLTTKIHDAADTPVAAPASSYALTAPHDTILPFLPILCNAQSSTLHPTLSKKTSTYAVVALFNCSAKSASL